MQNQFLAAEIEAEVRRRMDARDSFTALEISRAVQATGVRERHLHLKNAVHAMFDRGAMPGYQRRLIALPGGGQPWLYFPATGPARTPNRFAVALHALR